MGDKKQEDVEKAFKKFIEEDVEDAIKYDFSNDGANVAYWELNGIEKFFVYMCVKKDVLNEECFNKFPKKLFDAGEHFKKECKKYTRIQLPQKIYENLWIEYTGIVEPDSKSQLLQKIYENLWVEENLKPCKNKRNKIITGDTMNSVNTTLNKLYEEYIEEKFEKQKKERQKMKTKKGASQCVSIRYIINRYAENKEGVKGELKNFKGLENFIKSYHTLGNFIPVPVDCNAPRGQEPLKDYWDLTLACIYNWYAEKNNQKDRIINEKKRHTTSIRLLEKIKLEKINMKFG